MPIKIVKRSGVADRVLAQMREAILSGEWQPGMRIPSENELSISMGVSRVSVRAAIQKLTGLGLLESRQGDGTFVCSSSSIGWNALAPAILLCRPGLMDLLEFRMMIEVECAEIAAINVTDEILAEMEENLNRMSRPGIAPEGMSEIDIEFHILIAKATGNAVVLQVYTTLKDVFIESLNRMSSITGTSSGVEYHNKLFVAIKSRDGVAAKQLMREHLAVVHHSIETNSPID